MLILNNDLIESFVFTLVDLNTLYVDIKLGTLTQVKHKKTDLNTLYVDIKP